LIKKYISKFSEDGWLGVKQKHLKWLLEHISISSKNYLRKLIYFYGYYACNDRTTDKGLSLFTNEDRKYNPIPLGTTKIESYEDKKKKLKRKRTRTK